MYKSPSNYIEKFSIRYNKQFGFTAKYSTIHALILLTNKIQNCIYKGTPVGYLLILARLLILLIAKFY